MNGSETEPMGLDGSTLWKRVDDSKYSECLYRLTGDGQVEVLALGARVVVPINGLRELFSPNFRNEPACELRAMAKSAPAEEEP